MNIIADSLSANIQNFTMYCSAERNLSANTILAYLSDIREFIANINKIQPSILNKKLIDAYFVMLYQSQISRQSFLRKLSSINLFMKFLISIKVIDANPMSRIKRPKKEHILPKFLMPHELEKILHIASTLALTKKGIRDYCIMEILCATGMRVSELAKLKLKDIINNDSSKRQFIRIIGKGNKERMVPFRKKTIEVVQRYLSIRSQFTTASNNQYLFPSQSKSHHITREYIAKILKNLAIAANINPNHISPHVLRHSFATSLCNKKIDLRILQEILGHSDISTTEIYIDIQDKEIVDSVKSYHPISIKK